MTALRLRPGIGVCRFADCAIVLDVSSDRYSRVGETAGACLAAAAAGALLDEADPKAAEMARRGFLVPSHIDQSGSTRAPDWRQQSHHETPSSSTIGDARGQAPLDPRAFAAGILLPMITRLELRFAPLRRSLDRTFRTRPSAASVRPPIDELAKRFDRVRRLSPVRPRCLPDSLAFLRYVAAYGYRPKLVFGVTAHPFAAHCWVQDGDRVLTDALDHALQFRPIMVLQ